MNKTMIAGLALMAVASPAAAEIKIGLTGALTGPVAGTYAPAVEGLRLYIDGVNAAGGINGEPIELILQDDGAEPSRAGFVCDLFGHVSQLPRLLAGFGIDNAFGGRPVLTEDDVRTPVSRFLAAQVDSRDQGHSSL